jgi:hypothetical protein
MQFILCTPFIVIAGMLPSSAVSVVRRGSGRSRGRPRGSGVSLRSRGPGSIQRSLVAAEEAAATAAKTAAYAAYGYSFTGRANVMYKFNFAISELSYLLLSHH